MLRQMEVITHKRAAIFYFEWDLAMSVAWDFVSRRTCGEATQRLVNGYLRLAPVATHCALAATPIDCVVLAVCGGACLAITVPVFDAPVAVIFRGSAGEVRSRRERLRQFPAVGLSAF